MAYDYRDIDAAPLPWEEVTGNGRGLITAIVTPLDAQRLLENNKNRRLNKNTVLRYAAQMRAGEWDWCDGDSPLKMGPGGVLRNGQHRLNAQVLANVTGAYDIRLGVPEESYKVMDSGASRVVADYFYGRSDARNISALANRIAYAARGSIEPTGSYRGAKDENIPTRLEIVEFANAHYEELQAYASMGRRIRDQHRRGSLAAYGCALYICGRDRSELEAFVTAYVAGGDQTSTTKQTILRKLVEKSFKPRPAWYGGATIMALDAWADGRGLKVLRAQDIEARYRRAVQAFSEKALPVGGAV